MIAGLLLMDLLWALGLVGLTALAAFVGLALASALPSALGVALGLGAACLTWIAACAVILFALPKPRPGRYRLMRGRDFYAWILAFVVRRWLELPPMGLLFRQSALLRFLVLRAAGAKVAFTAQISSDAVLLDPGLLTLGAGAMLGSGSSVAGHFIIGDRLVLAPVVIMAGAQIAFQVAVGPGARIGRNALIDARVGIGPKVIVGDDAIVGGDSGLGYGVVVGDRAHIAVGSIVPAGTQIPDGGSWPPPSPMTKDAPP